MDGSQPGLFDLPDLEQPDLPKRSGRGRNRETWACTVTAEVTVVDADALLEALARAEDEAVTIELRIDDADVEQQDEDLAAENDLFNALTWLIWPTDGMDELAEAGAIHLLSVESEAVAESADHGRATWTVTFKLTDVEQLRQLAVQAKPAESGLIASSLAAAWQSAVDPFAPLRSIPGIEWQAGQVQVEYLPAKPTRGG